MAWLKAQKWNWVDRGEGQSSEGSDRVQVSIRRRVVKILPQRVWQASLVLRLRRSQSLLLSKRPVKARGGTVWHRRLGALKGEFEGRVWKYAVQAKDRKR